MPITSRVSVKASIIYLALGAALGAILLIDRWIPLGSAVYVLRVSHIQFLVVGWLTQLIIGVAWWLFPPLAIGLRDDSPLPVRRGQSQRGSEALFWTALVCLNAGILLRALFEPLHSWTTISLFSVLAGLSGLFLLVAGVLFVVNLWGRVRELGKTKVSSEPGS
jgi:hypothetical protein